MEKLKRCPFCGGAAKLYEPCGVTPVYGENGAYVDAIWDDGPSYVFCTKCDAQSNGFNSGEGAITAWNHRTDDQRYAFPEEFHRELQWADENAEYVSDPEGIHVDVAKHCVGLDYHKVYKRAGKRFYNPYRNYFSCGDSVSEHDPDKAALITLKSIGYVEGNGMYRLTDAGFAWLGDVINAKIYTDKEMHR